MQSHGSSPKLTPSDLGYSRTVKVSEPWTVEKVVEAIPDAPAPGASTPLPFFHMLGRLKTTKREGWRRFGIDRYCRPPHKRQDF